MWLAVAFHEKFSPPLIWLFWKALMNNFPSDTVYCFKYHPELFSVIIPYEEDTVANFIKYQVAFSMISLC